MKFFKFILLFIIFSKAAYSVKVEKKMCAYSLAILGDALPPLESIDSSDKLVIEDVLRNIFDNSNYTLSHSELDTFKEYQLEEELEKYKLEHSERQKEILKQVRKHQALKGGLFSFIGALSFKPVTSILNSYFRIESYVNKKYGLNLSDNNDLVTHYLRRVLDCMKPKYRKLRLQDKEWKNIESAEDLLYEMLAHNPQAKESSLEERKKFFSSIYTLWEEHKLVLCPLEKGFNSVDQKMLDDFIQASEDSVGLGNLRLLGIRAIAPTRKKLRKKRIDSFQKSGSTMRSPLSEILTREDLQRFTNFEEVIQRFQNSYVIQESGLYKELELDDFLEEFSPPKEESEARKLDSDINFAKRTALHFKDNLKSKWTEHRKIKSEEKHLDNQEKKDMHGSSASISANASIEISEKLTNEQTAPTKKKKVMPKILKGRLIIPTQREIPENFLFGDYDQWVLKRSFASAMLKNPYFTKINLKLLNEWKNLKLRQAEATRAIIEELKILAPKLPVKELLMKAGPKLLQKHFKKISQVLKAHEITNLEPSDTLKNQKMPNINTVFSFLTSKNKAQNVKEKTQQLSAFLSVQTELVSLFSELGMSNEEIASTMNNILSPDNVDTVLELKRQIKRLEEYNKAISWSIEGKNNPLIYLQEAYACLWTIECLQYLQKNFKSTIKAPNKKGPLAPYDLRKLKFQLNINTSYEYGSYFSKNVTDIQPALGELGLKLNSFEDNIKKRKKMKQSLDSLFEIKDFAN